MAISIISEQSRGAARRHPDRAMSRFLRWPDSPSGIGQIDDAELLRPEIVFGHEREAPKRPKAARPRNGPARFLKNLSVKRVQRRFACIDPAARKLVFRPRFGLKGQQETPVPREYRIDPGPQPVANPRARRLAESSDHPTLQARGLSCPHGRDMPKRGIEGKPMTLGQKIAWDDTILPFQLDRADIRGRVARLDGVLDTILGQHDYPPPVEALIAEMALLTALIGQTVKLRWKLSMQVQSKGAVRMIATDYFAPREAGEPALLRAYAGFDPDRLRHARPFDQLGEGYFALLIDQGAGTTPYRGITPLAGDALHRCAEAYFAQSEQLPTRFALSFGKTSAPNAPDRWRAGGVMLQHMPKASPFARDGGSGEGGLLEARDLVDGDDAENWSRANLLLDTVEDPEMIGPSVSPADLLVRLFHEEGPRVFEMQPVRFGCTCSEDRVRDSLSIYSARDIESMTTEEGTVTADCQFCGARYTLDPASLGFDAPGDSGEDG